MVAGAHEAWDPEVMTVLDENVDRRVIIELEPVVAAETERHISMAKPWYPHDYIPWDEGRNFALLGGEDWSPDQQRLSDAARTSLIVNLLTEDNLPSYHTAIATVSTGVGAWGEWLGRWTAEEARHAVAIRDYLVVTRTLDPVAVEDMRMVHMTEGFQPIHPGILSGIAYVSFQELATRLSHRNTGIASGDPICDQMMQRIALDENLHMIFYRNVINAAFEIAPDETMRAVTDIVRDFAMPGHSIEGFTRKAMEIAVAGIYDLRQHIDDVVMPVLRYWKVFDRTDFGAGGEIARQELSDYIAGLEVQAERFENKREALAKRLGWVD